ncbi:MAG: ATPase, T2SS/T4P/T4SS family, partial [Eubacteriales bacterium]
MAIKQDRKRLGEILIDGGVISEQQLTSALKLQKSLGMRLGEILIRQGYVTEDDILRTMKSQLNLPFLDLNKLMVTEEIIKLIPEPVARKYEVVPIDIKNGRLIVAMNDPTNYYALDDIRIVVGMLVRPAIARKIDIDKAIDRYYGRSEAEKAAREYAKQAGVSPVAAALQMSTASLNNGQDEEGDTPVIKFLNTIIENAVNNMASDIHIEPVENELRVRFRIDGVMREILKTPISMAGPVVSRVKIMSDLNIAERRLPQDGRISYTVANRRVDLRVSIIPTIFGEKVVMRILDRASVILEKEKLGLQGKNLQLFDNLISKAYGIVLVTGPTGSG